MITDNHLKYLKKSIIRYIQGYFQENINKKNVALSPYQFFNHLYALEKESYRRHLS